ncbi:MAG: hypothetical protein RL745_551 [Actinomycetota bacterium]
MGEAPGVARTEIGRGDTATTHSSGSVSAHGAASDVHQHRRVDIQALRGLAVLLVIAAHAGAPGLAGGYIGVDVFFVVSGYVITQALMRTFHEGLFRGLGRFYRQRIARLLPAATLVLCCTLLASVWVLGPQMDPRLPVDARWASLFAENFNLINGRIDYFLPGVDPSPVLHFWSLAVEEQFYLVYPLMILIPLALLRPKNAKPVAVALLLVAVAMSAVWSAVSTNADPTVAYYSPLTRFWELGLGGLVALAPVVRLPNVIRTAAQAATVAGIVALAAIFDAQSKVPGIAAWGPCAATAVCVYVGAEEAHPQRWVPTKPLAAIGDISYSLYLWHFAWLLLPLQMFTSAPPASIAAIAVTGTLACAWLSYRYVEEPVRRSPKLRNDSVSAALMVTCCVLLVWNASIYAQAAVFSP